MPPFALSDERLAALANLMQDEAAFEQAYPRVADYLSMAEQLAGTGDAVADAAFDLRLLHFMTGGESVDPYWDIVAPSVAAGPPERGGRREVNGGRAKGSARLGYAQIVVQATYAYAVPAPETLAWIADITRGRSVVEIGAGRGYWASQLAESGVPITAYDTHPPDRANNTSFPSAAGQPHIWHPIQELRDADAYRDIADAADVLLLCWPPGWANPMASGALDAYQRVGGDLLIYIGEPPGGRTADAAFFHALEANWELVDQDPDYVAWWNLADSAQCWRRR
ncbi:hypothetical protein [Nocardia sp. NPDC004604]|uniref:hypothetical protein n=1 Tax=Nocardia sp. NPDC004604 TaxID=3157013 RepID=UPI0033B3F38C